MNIRKRKTNMILLNTKHDTRKEKKKKWEEGNRAQAGETLVTFVLNRHNRENKEE